MISHPEPEKYPYSDVNWILRIGRKDASLRKPIFSTNSLENAVDMAKSGVGIIGSYQEISIIEKSGLHNVLADVTAEPIEWYLLYRAELDDEEENKKVRQYLLDKFKHLRPLEKRSDFF